MPNYNQTNVSGTQWQRCHTVKITNQLNLAKKIEFEEEKVIDLDGKYFHDWTVGCSKEFSDTGEFSILNLETGQPTSETMTHAQLYQALYSLYMQTAQERDNA